ncbi:MAG: TRAP transporter TAXI family solute receptor [Saprospiraceae bacterium]|jgi:TRAP transporter TAXI family solute receptor
MHFSSRFIRTGAILLATLIQPSFAQGYGIGILTGTKTGTYIQFGQNIAEMSKREGLNINVVPTEGSVENIQRLIDNENAGMAIVQSDVLRYLKNSKDPELNSIAEKIRLIFPFYNEEVHILANKSITSFDQLNGKRVAVGSTGSGTRLTANNLFRLADITPSEKLSQGTAEALTMLITKQIHAMVYVAGKPVQLFEMLDTEEWSDELKSLIGELHFLPLNNPDILENYTLSSISHSDYEFIEEPVNTVAVKPC